MNNSLKIGAISGLIAGIAKAVVSIIIAAPLVFRFGPALAYYFLQPPPITPFTKIITVEIVGNLILGVIFGLIYSMAYRVIPMKGVLKGLLFGLFGYLVGHLYWATLWLIYGRFDWAVACVWWGIIVWVPFGIILGVIYEFFHSRYYRPRREPKIVQYGMRGGFLPGTIAGLLGGVASFIANFTITYDFAELIAPGHVIDLHLLLIQLSGQIMFHMIWGIFFGLIYPKVYNLVPGKGIIKGLSYGLIAQFLILEFTAMVFNIGYGNFVTAHIQLALGGSNAIVFGLVLGYLYKPPK